MPEPSQDPDVSQVLSAIRQLIEQGRPPSRPAPFLLTPELRVAGPQRPVPARASPPRPEASLIDATPFDGRAASPDVPGVPPSSPAGPGESILPRDADPTPEQPSPAADAMPFPVPDASGPIGAAEPSSPGLLVTEGPRRPDLLVLTNPVAPLPDEPAFREETPVPLESAAEPAPELAAGVDDPAAIPSPADLAPPSEEEILAIDEEPGPPAAEEEPSSEASAPERLRPAGSHAPDRAPPIPEEPDLSAFMPLAGLPPAMALVRSGAPRPPPMDEPAQDDAEELAAWAGPDLAGPDQPDPTALPDDDLTGLLPDDPVPPAEPEDGLRDRVVAIVRETLQREVGDLRQVVRQEVREALADLKQD